MAIKQSSVLLVDDEPLEAALFVRALRKSGFENVVQVFTSSEQAKRYLQGDGEYGNRAQFPIPGLVILDHRMPGDNGWDVLAFMRQDASLQNVPAVVFSGSGAAAEEAKANELGAAFQVKPQSSDEYQAVVKRMAEFWLRGGLD